MKRDAGATGIARFGAFDIEIYHDRILATPDHDGFTNLVRGSVQFLMRNVGRHINEISGPSLSTELQMIAPAHACPATDDVEDSFELAMVMRTGSGIWLDDHGASPEFRRASPRMRDCGRTTHARCLRGVGIEIIRRNDFDAVLLPIHPFHNSVFTGLRMHTNGGGTLRVQLVCHGWLWELSVASY